MNSYLRETIAEVVAEISEKKIEHAVVLDLSGEEIWRGSGSTTKVAVPSDAVLGNVLIHNHPNSSWFSVEDLNYAWQHNVALMVVCSPRFVYFLERPVKGWSAGLVAAWPKLQGCDMHEVLTTAARTHQFYYRRWPRARSGATFIVSRQGTAEECFK